MGDCEKFRKIKNTKQEGGESVKAATYRKKIKKDMEAVGTYRPEFDRTIAALALTYEDRDEIREEFKRTGGNFVVKHVNKNGSSNPVKNPFVVILDRLDDKILQYNRELGLTPAGLKKINDKSLKIEKASGLEAAMKGMFDDL